MQRQSRFEVTSRFARLAALAAALLGSGCGAAALPPVPPETGTAAWGELTRGLPGTWSTPGTGASPVPVTVAYRIVSSGSVLVETWAVGTDHETMTVFHRDGDDVVLTHYCAQGNQPRLRIAAVSADTLVFRFADATNVRPDQAVLVERTLRFTGDALDDTEVYRQPDGKPETTTYRFTRKAAPPPG